MNMIERVARAINPKAFDEDYQQWFIFKCWQDEAAEKALKQARVAIEAMREPNEEMIESGVTAEHGKTLGERVTSEYQSMINAALTA